MERIEDETEDLPRHDTQQGLHIARLSEDDGRVGLALGERKVALGYRSSDRGAVGKREVHLPLGNEADGTPRVLGQQRVHRPAVDQEADRPLAIGTTHGTLDVAQAHAPEDGSSLSGRTIEILQAGTE